MMRKQMASTRIVATFGSIELNTSIIESDASSMVNSNALSEFL
jgi:hypothetical protein